MTPRLTQLRRSLTTVIAILSLTVGAMLATAAPASAVAYKMPQVFNGNATGDVLVAGNSVLTCATGVTNCGSAQGGGNYANDAFNMGYIDVDTDSSTFNSSSADVTLPAGATVLFAALSWGATTAASTSTGLVGTAAPDASLKNKVSFKPPGGSYATVTADKLDVSGAVFQGYANVTTAVAAAGSGTYTVGNLQAGTGGDRYGGWSLAVAYRDATQPMRKLVVLRGFFNVASPTFTSTLISGFTTPATGSVVTHLGAVAYEGDKGQTGDYLKLGTTSLSDGFNPATDVFNSTVTDLGVAVTSRLPSYANTLGFDIDRFDATGVLANGATSATINIGTGGTGSDSYYPALVTFATDIKAPTLSAVKTMTDVNGGTLAPGDLVDYSVGITNTGAETAALSEVTDVVPAGTTYVSGSLKVGGAAVTDQSGDDAGDVASGTVKARIGTGADNAFGGALQVNDTATVAFRVEVDAGAGDASVISNAATLDYKSGTTGAGFSSQSNTVTGTVVDAPLLTFSAPPAGRLGAAYNQQLARTGGTSPYAWSVSAGALPPGLTLGASSGLLSGTPTTPGSTSFTVKVTDAHARTDTRAVTFVVERALTTISLTSSAETTQFGLPVTLDANVGPPGLTGAVTFTDVPSSGPESGNTITLGTRFVSNGAARLTLPLPAFGLHSIEATYSGDSTYEGVTSSPVPVEVTGYAGEIIVNEFRGSGPAGQEDSYVELSNTGPAVPLGGVVVSSDSGATVTLPSTAGTLETGRSYLIAGADFSLRAVATPDLVESLGTGGLQIQTPDSAATQTDAVGPDGGFHRGRGLPALSNAITNEHAWVRWQQAGRTHDSGNNAADFRLVSATGGQVGGVQSMLGSASPTGTTDPYQHNGDLRSSLLDPAAAVNAAPNRLVAYTTPGTLTIRRTITNTSSDVVTAAKVRITALSEANGDAKPPWAATTPARRANLRAVNPVTATSQFTLDPCEPSVTVQNLSVDAPVSGTPGGGLNTTLSVPLPQGGLGAGESVSVAFTFRFDTRGTFWFSYDIDASGGTVVNRIARDNQPKHDLSVSGQKRLAAQNRTGSLVKVRLESGQLRRSTQPAATPARRCA